MVKGTCADKLTNNLNWKCSITTITNCLTCDGGVN